MFWELGDVKILFSFDVGMSAKIRADDSKSSITFAFHFTCRQTGLWLHVACHGNLPDVRQA